MKRFVIPAGNPSRFIHDMKISRNQEAGGGLVAEVFGD